MGERYELSMERSDGWRAVSHLQSDVWPDVFERTGFDAAVRVDLEFHILDIAAGLCPDGSHLLQDCAHLRIALCNSWRTLQQSATYAVAHIGNTADTWTLDTLSSPSMLHESIQKGIWRGLSRHLYFCNNLKHYKSFAKEQAQEKNCPKEESKSMMLIRKLAVQTYTSNEVCQGCFL